ncbi:hypothetical protein AMS69_04320 [Haloarcula rubripromontorii]|uniref:Uncharacterized protein n=1 Tax=Haloarcula rubripromontorii TaxID=1705562 RepID=A0A0M9AMJ9_9EURY|nr:hypothetical protein [Haloarcula rubripromontorii]KOX95087.1 hypothetical protein AMS69_04320 [Haloarcula rubripromontorii]
MGLFDTIRRAVGGDDSSTDGDERTAGGDSSSDDGPDRLDTATLDPTAFRKYAERVVDGADPLTFDPDALARLDTAIEESYGGETVGDAAGTTTYTENTVRFGSYLGELLVRAYDGEWVQADGRWGVTVAGPDDEVGVAVFDVAARSFGDEPVFAAVVTRLESELALDSIQNDGPAIPETDETETDSVVSEPTRIVSCVDDGQAGERDAPPEPTATDERGETTAGETAASAPSQAVETEPTRVVRRVDSDAETGDRSDDADPTPVAGDVADEPANEAPPGNETEDSASDIAGDANPDPTDSASDDAGSEPPTAETTEAKSTAVPSDRESATDTPAAAETATDEPAGTAAADEAAAYIDEAESSFDSATAAPSDDAPATETPPEGTPVDSRDDDGAGDTAPAGPATDTPADEAVTDTPADGPVDASMDDEPTYHSSSDASSADTPDAEAASETTADESLADIDNTAAVDDEPAAVTESDAGKLSDDSPDTSAPVADAEASGATATTPLQDGPADETATTAATDESEPSAPIKGDSTARSWDPGTVRADHADTAVEFAEFWGEHDLDFSPASLSRLDDLVDTEWDDERFAETTFGSDAEFDDRAFTSVVRELGGYFGEVLVRHLDGDWTDETDHEAAVVVGGPDGQFAVPVFEVAITSLRKRAVFGRSYDALLDDLGRDGPTR